MKSVDKVFTVVSSVNHAAKTHVWEWPHGTNELSTSQRKWKEKKSSLQCAPVRIKCDVAGFLSVCVFASSKLLWQCWQGGKGWKSVATCTLTYTHMYTHRIYVQHSERHIWATSFVDEIYRGLPQKEGRIGWNGTGLMSSTGTAGTRTQYEISGNSCTPGNYASIMCSKCDAHSGWWWEVNLVCRCEFSNKWMLLFYYFLIHKTKKIGEHQSIG